MRSLEVRIRNVDKSLIKYIDELANKKGMSRQEFLKIYLERVGSSSALRDEQRRIDDNLTDIKKVVLMIHRRTKDMDDKMENLLSFISSETRIPIDNVDLVNG